MRLKDYSDEELLDELERRVAYHKAEGDEIRRAVQEVLDFHEGGMSWGDIIGHLIGAAQEEGYEEEEFIRLVTEAIDSRVGDMIWQTFQRG